MAGARGTHRKTKAPGDAPAAQPDTAQDRALLARIDPLRTKALDALTTRLDVVTKPEAHDTGEILQIIRYLDGAAALAADRIQRATGWDPAVGLASAAASHFRLAGQADQDPMLGVGAEPKPAA